MFPSLKPVLFQVAVLGLANLLLLPSVRGQVDDLYVSYREGTVKRHITSNGRYLQYIWLRSKDKVDTGESDWIYSDYKIPADGNARVEILPSGNQHIFLPVVYYEELQREIPQGYRKGNVIGYLSPRPGPDLVPLYEWYHDLQFQERGNFYFRDHYYSTDPESPVVRFRYRRTGIIGFVSRRQIPGLVPLFVGFDESERNHKLSTDAQNPQGLKNFKRVGFIRPPGVNGASGQLVIPPRPPGGPLLVSHLNVPLTEHRHIPDESEYGRAWQFDNLYSATIRERKPFLRLFSRWESREYLSRAVVAGGGDNPLYEGGLALATFSLEHLHQVSPNSITYAKRLFEFLETSEEKEYGQLTGLTPRDQGGQGYFRRTRSYWREAGSWGASTDELVGVFLGLHYFIAATQTQSDLAAYNQRAKNLLVRIARKINNRNGVYSDPRIPYSLGYYYNNLMAKKCADVSSGMLSVACVGGGFDVNTHFPGENLVSNGTGTLMFHYPFNRVVGRWESDEVSYLGQPSFDQFMESIGELGSALPYALNALAFYPVTRCLVDLASWVSSEFTNTPNIDLDCFSLDPINTHGEIYELLVHNSLNVLQVECPDEGFFNNALLLFTGLMVLDPLTVGGSLSHARAEEFAKEFLRYTKGSMECCAEDNPSKGIAWDNLLTAIVARRSFQLLSSEQEEDVLGDQVHEFRQRVDQVIDKYLADMTSSNTAWQPHLPLGKPPVQDTERPWAEVEIPPGVGKNQAWQRQFGDFEFRFRSENQMFSEVGPYYVKGNGENNGANVEETLRNFQRFARVGFPADAFESIRLQEDGPYAVVEAGGNDLLFMRMLLTHFNWVKPVLPETESLFPLLPVQGSTPWEDTTQRPTPETLEWRRSIGPGLRPNG